MSGRRLAPAMVLFVLLALVAWWLVGSSDDSGASLVEAAPRTQPFPAEIPPPNFEAESPVSRVTDPAAVTLLVDAPARQAAATPAPNGRAIVVVDEMSTTVPGARVETWADEDDDWQEGLPPVHIFETDAAGRCTWPFVGDTGVLVATREGLGSSGYVDARSLNYLVSLSGEAVVRLEPRSRLRGRVVEADDRPAAGVPVEFWPFGGGRPPRPVQADARGKFEVEVDAGVGLGLEARDGERRSNQVRYITQPRGECEVLLRLPGDWTVGGIVFSRRAEPLANVKVLLWRNIPEWFLPRDEQPDVLPNSWFDEEVTGADGRFVFRVRERLGYTVIAQVPGELPSPAAEVVIDAERQHVFVELRPPEPSFIAGRVVDRDGAGVPDVTVRAITGTMWSPHDRLYEPWPKDRWGEGGSARTNAQGAFRIEGLHPDGLYRVGVLGTIRDMRRPDPATDVHAGRSDVLLVQDGPLGARVSVTFSVHSTTDGSVLADPSITIYRLVDDGGYSAGLGSERLPDGRVTFHKFTSGIRYAALVEVTGFATVDVPAWVAGPDLTDIDVLLPRPATLQVDVRRANGDPAAWADVRVTPLVERLQGSNPWRRDADASGRVRFMDVDPGPFGVTGRAGGREASQDVELRDGETRTLQIILPD